MPLALDIIEHAMRRSEAGWKSALTAAGTTTTVTDAGLVDHEHDTNSWSSIFLYTPGSATSDQLRRVKADAGYTVGSGILAIASGHPWGVAPAIGATYYACGHAPIHPMPGQSYSWFAALNDALRREYYIDEVSLGVGLTSGQREFSVTATVPSALRLEDVQSVRLRTDPQGNGVYRYQDAQKNGYDYDVTEDAGVVTIKFLYAPTTSQTILVKVRRSYVEATELTADSDSVSCELFRASAAVRVAFFKALNGMPSTRGKFDVELKLAIDAYNDVRQSITPVGKGT